MVQVYTHKTTTSLKANATEGHPVHIVVRNCAGTYRRNLIDHGHTFVGCFLVSTAEQEELCKPDSVVNCTSISESNPVVPLTDEIPQTSQWNGTDLRIAILYAATEKLLQALSAPVETGIEVLLSAKVQKCHPIIISY